MPGRTVKIKLTSNPTEDEWRCIDVFNYRADLLGATRLSRNPQISAIQGRTMLSQRGLSFQGSLPPEDALTEHLLAFRHFVLQREPCYFQRVVSILARNAREDDAQEAFQWLKERWNAALFDGAIEISSHRGRITAGKLIDIWFNGHYFHNDCAKGAELRELWRLFSEPMTKYLLVEAIYSGTRVVQRLHHGLKHLKSNISG